MPGGKRIPTPPPPEDEPRYLTVVHPYPLNANLELHADRRTLALWLACCTGKDVLYAMFHKPASPGMVVIEVDRDFDSFDRLLGLHTWSKFLQKPSAEQADKVSKVFYCTYNTGRQVEKSGWKRVNIEEHWFNGWTANNAIIKHPYPKTTHCHVPSEAKTGAPMCRPLPQKSFPVPPPKPAPIVGTPEWLAARSDNPTASPTPSTTRKARTAAPSVAASVTSTSSRGAKSSFSPPPSATPSSAPSSVMANYRAKNDGAWKRGPPSTASSVATAATSRAPSTAGSASVWSARGPPRPPPGLAPRSPTSQSRTSDRFDWSEDVERHESDQRNNPPVRSPAPSLSSNPARRPPYDPDGPIEPSREYEYTEEDQPRHSTVAAMSDIFENDPYPPAPSVRSGRGGTRPPGIDDPDFDPWNAPAEPAGAAFDQPEVVDPAKPWATYGAHRQELPTKVQKRGEWSCNLHGPLCKPGICKERARVERDERMRIEREGWEEQRIQREANRAKKKAKEAKREEEAEAMGLGGRQRPHLRGNNNSNSNKSGTDTDTDDDSNAPPQEDWPITWEAKEGTDTQSVVSSARRAWNSVARSDDEDDYADGDDGLIVAPSHTTNTTTSSGGSRSGSSHPTPPASVIAGGRSKGPPVSPRPPTRQSGWDARSTTSSASQTPSVVPENVWPTESGFSSRAPSVSAAGSDNGRRSGTRSATRSDGRSSVSSNARGGRPAPSTTSSAASGFPTFADTHWGDPIAMALAAAAKDDRLDRGGSEAGTGEEVPSGPKASKSSKRRKNKMKSALVQEQAVRVSTLEEAVLDVQLPPGGPGSSWGDPNEAW